MDMDRQSKEPVSNIDDDELKVLVRSSPEELDSGALDRVAGGAGVIIDPNG
jgi:hypothetical protein